MTPSRASREKEFSVSEIQNWEMRDPIGNANIRMVGTPDDLWFVMKDVCRSVDHSQPAKAVEGLDSDEKGVREVHTPGGMQKMLCVSESGLYKFLLRSNLPKAEPFARWVTREAIPTVRKVRTGQMDPSAGAEKLFGGAALWPRFTYQQSLDRRLPSMREFRLALESQSPGVRALAEELMAEARLEAGLMPELQRVDPATSTADSDRTTAFIPEGDEPPPKTETRPPPAEEFAPWRRRSNASFGDQPEPKTARTDPEKPPEDPPVETVQGKLFPDGKAPGLREKDPWSGHASRLPPAPPVPEERRSPPSYVASPSRANTLLRAMTVWEWYFPDVVLAPRFSEFFHSVCAAGFKQARERDPDRKGDLVTASNGYAVEPFIYHVADWWILADAVHKYRSSWDGQRLKERKKRMVLDLFWDEHGAAVGEEAGRSEVMSVRLLKLQTSDIERPDDSGLVKYYEAHTDYKQAHNIPVRGCKAGSTRKTKDRKE